ncbi:hypothetical protein SAMN06265371_102172 [Lutibacter agarilyticus]|uniref:TonB C-terminal domain-containing protein n=1 Tax=Lutibacter agarilyticus TaxID=1109740 RepID=A0A238VW84_9FLAO|nr:hypothetical protein [Lutibacter agarilyticus]SNR38546.1 hypothetical protein SAMN06265371_102172 [Lutibacter agarilyticus]
MNKFKLLAIAFVLGTTSLFANNIVNPEVSKDEIRQQIIELVQHSVNTIDNQVTVNVTFTFSTSGEIIVKKVSSTDKEVLAFIRENINSKILENPGRANRNFTMPIVIK